MEYSRTKTAILNGTTGSVMQICSIVFNFIGRTIFIYLLDTDYLGVNSLYTNILMVLSFAELGIGNAIAYCLYKPIAENDKDKIQALMKFYRMAYRIIGMVVLVAGLCVIPFMGMIIKETPDVKENLTFIYMLFLLNSVVSYFFSYKKTLIIAYQKEYIVQIYIRIFQLLQIVLQSLFLVITHEYVTYLIIYILCTISQNVALSIKADKLYPFLKEKNNNTLNKEETRSIFDNVKALFLYKFGFVILNSTDSIIISMLMNVSVVGIASNYTSLMTNVTNVIGTAVNSMTASVGNLSVTGSKEQIRSVMHQLLLVCVWLYGFSTIGFLVLVNDFIRLWIGNKYLLDQSVVAAILFSIYVNGVQYAAYSLRVTQGLFVQSRYVPVLAAVLNIILSVWWGKKIGLAGVFVATGVSRMVTTTVVDPWLVYKNNFSGKPYEYYRKYVCESIVVLINAGIQMRFIGSIMINGWKGFIIKLVILCISTNAVFLLAFGWTQEFRLILKRVRSITNKHINARMGRKRL